MNPYLTASMASPPQHYPVGNPPLQQQQQYQQQQQQQQQQVPSQLSLLQRQQLLQQQEHMRLQQFQQEHQRQQQMANANTNVPRSHESVTDASIFTSLPSQQSPPQQQQPQQQQQQYNTTANTYPAKQNWDILTGPNAIDDPLALISPDGSLIQMPRWDSYDLGNLPPVQIAPRAKNLPVAPLSRTPDYMTAQQHPSMRHNYIPQQQQQQQQQQQNMLQHPHLVHNEYLLDTPSPVPTMSSLDISVQQQQQHHQQQQQQLQQQQQQQQQMSTSPVNVPEYLQSSCSPEMPIKASPIEHQLSWASWEESSPRHNDDLAYATPAHTHTSFDEGSRDDVDFTNTKRLKVFTSSKKDDDGEFRKGQQFYLNIHLNPEDQERFRYLRIPAENIVLPCKADSSGRVGLNASGKRSSDAMSLPTSAQEEDVLSLKLTTFLEPEHRMVVPCGRCKDKTPEILRFHPGVNGKPMIDENGMVTLRDGQVKLIASAWCASTSHHRGPGTKFSFQVELTSMTQYQEPVLVYEGRSDEVEIYASHGRDKGTRIANKNEKASKSHSPPLERGSAGPPSPAKTASSSPPSSPSSSMAQYDTGPVKKRREDPPMTPPLLDSDLPPTIKSLEPRKGPICRENHVIIIGQNFARGMTPMFGRDFGTVIDINPYYIECTTPRYPHTETVRLWLYHNDNYIATDKTYEFTDEQAQSDMEQLLRNLVQSDGEAGDAGSYLALMERLAGLPSSTDISGQSQSNGSTMLHNSVLLGYQAGVNLLIEEGIELDVEDDAGLTALDYAIYTNNVEIAGTLLSAGSMLSSERLDTLTLRPTQEMSTMLMDLCGVDLPTSPADQVPSSPVEEISSSAVPLGSLIQETILEETEPTEDESALESPPTLTTSHTASQPRPVPQRSARPLSIATVSTHSTGMVSLAPTMSTMAPSATSSTQSRSTMMGRPANHSSKGLENIWQGAKKGSLSLVKYHLEKEPNLINAPWKFDGRSVLSSACASSQPQELVEFLVMRGAHVNSADTFYKRTALHTLCEEGGLSQDDWRIVVSQADQEANERDVLAAMRFLLDKGAVVDAKNHWKETALMRLFAGRDCPLMVQELYSRGADSRLKSSKDAYPHGTALSYAAYYGRIKSLKWMIENDLLLNDEATIKDAIRWAKASKGESSQGSQQVPVMQSASMVRRKEERKAEAIRLLESWLGESGQTKRKTLARELAVETADGWWQRMSGIVDESKKPGLSSSAPSSSSSSSDPTLAKLPAEMRPLWKDVHALSESLVSSSDQVSSSSSRMKWNPLTMLRK